MALNYDSGGVMVTTTEIWRHDAMPQPCTVCNHPSLDLVNRALVMGAPFLRIAAHFSVTEQSLRRHKTNHLPGVLAKAQEAQDVAQADNLLTQLNWLQWNALSILDEARREGDGRTALAAIRQARGNLVLLAKLQGELNDNAQTNELNDLFARPEWVAIRAVLMEALQAHPAARAEVAQSLLRLEEDGL
jgi:hypothetical protein